MKVTCLKSTYDNGFRPKIATPMIKPILEKPKQDL